MLQKLHLFSLGNTLGSLMTVVCALVWLSPPLYAKASVSCNSGLEFDCKAVQGNGEACVLGCNLTVTRTLSPGNCSEDCCKICFSNCIGCTYSKLIRFCIYVNNSSWIQMFEKENKEFNAMNKDIQSSIVASIQNRNLTSLKSEIVGVKQCPSNKESIQVDVKVVMNNIHKLGIIVENIKNATRSGQLDKLTLVKNVFDVMDEQTYKETMMKDTKMREEKIDIVELVITCMAALIIILAIVWCLFYMCTTPRERERFKCCNPCRRNRTANAS